MAALTGVAVMPATAGTATPEQCAAWAPPSPPMEGCPRSMEGIPGPHPAPVPFTCASLRTDAPPVAGCPHPTEAEAVVLTDALIRPLALNSNVVARKCVRWTSPVARWEVKITSGNVNQPGPMTAHHDVQSNGVTIDGAGGNYAASPLRILLAAYAPEPNGLREWRPNVPDSQFTGSYTQLDYDAVFPFYPNTTACNPGQPGYSTWISNTP